MFLKTITFRKKKITSNASRRINYFFFKFKLNFNLFPNHVVHFRVFQPAQAGRGALGKNIIRSKGGQLRKIGTFAVNFNLRYLKLGFIAAFRLLPFKNKLLSLVFFANGATTFFLTAHNHNLFKFWFHNNVKKIKKLKIFKKLPLFRILNRIKKLSFVSCLELLPGKNAQYVRSTGTKARLIKFDKISHTVLLQLPSKIKKIFSYYSYALYDQLALADYKWFKNTKSGYWRVFGKKSIVRGVAMNPVDHPHGGRTKTVKTPLTPWGKITKFK